MSRKTPTLFAALLLLSGACSSDDVKTQAAAAQSKVSQAVDVAKDAAGKAGGAAASAASKAGDAAKSAATALFDRASAILAVKAEIDKVYRTAADYDVDISVEGSN